LRRELESEDQPGVADVAGPQAPPAPAEPAQPDQPIGPDVLTGSVEAQQRQAERLGRERELARIEKVTGRSLTEQEQEIVLPRLEQNLDAIDQRSVEILNRYQNLTRPSRLQRAGLFLAKAIGTGVVATGLRSLIRATPLGFMAGTITGGILGSVYGALRGYRIEMKSHFGAGAVRQEYEKIKQENPDNPEAALAFLQSVLEGRGDESGVIGTELADQGQQGGMRYAATRTLQSAGRRAESWLSREQGYQGDLSGLLELITFYRNEAHGLYQNQENGEEIQQVDEHLLRALSAPGQGLRENYRNSVREACRAAARSGAWKGALIGAGVGAASDLISWFASNLRAEGTERAYIADQQSPERTLHTEFHDRPGEWLSQAQEQFYDHGLSRQTDFGNSLSEAIKTYIGDDTAKLPQNLQNQLETWIERGGSEDSFLRQVIEPFHFARPLPQHEYFYHGQDLQFNYRALQQILDNAYRGVDMRTLTYPENFFDTLQNADRILSVDFPQQVAEEAARAGVQAAAHEPVAQSLLHGAGIGIGATRGADKYVKAEGPRGGSGSGGGASGEQGAGDGERGEGAATRTTAQREDAGREAEGNGNDNNAEERPETQAERTLLQKEIEFDYSKALNWEELMAETEKDDFEQAADQVLDDIIKQDWEKQADMAKINFISLSIAIFNSRGQGRPKARFINEQTTSRYKLDKLPNLNDPTITLKKDEKGSREIIKINLSDDNSRQQLEPFNIQII